MTIARFKRLILGSGLTGTDNGDDTITVAVGSIPPSGAAGGVLDGTYPNPGLAAAVAGAGLAETTNVLSVNVDGSTIEIATDTLQVRNAGIGVAKLTSGAAASGTVAEADGAGAVSFLARIKSLCKNGSTALTGAVTLSGGSGVTLTQTGQDISIAATGGGTPGSNFVATDVIWDAKGDLAAGTGADAAIRVAVGTDGYVLGADSAQTAGIGWVKAAYTIICDSTLGSDQASFDTNTILGGNIPANFKHLFLEMSLRSDRSATTDNAMLVLNNDTTNANYNSQRISAINNAATATQFIGTITGIILGTTTAGTAPANSFAPFAVDLIDYLSGNLKMALSESSNYFATGSGGIDRQVLSGVWLSTAALTRIKVAPLTGTNWKTNSRFTLYGLP